MWSLITVTTALAPLPHQPHYAILGLANNHRKVCLCTEYKAIFKLKGGHNIMHGLKHLFHQLGCLSAGAMVLVILLYTVYPLLHAYYPLVSNPTLQFIR